MISKRIKRKVQPFFSSWESINGTGNSRSESGNSRLETPYLAESDLPVSCKVHPTCDSSGCSRGGEDLALDSVVGTAAHQLLALD